MIHGTTDRLRTWCMDEVVAVGGWALEADSVECIECLRRQDAALREDNARLRAKLAKVRGAVDRYMECPIDSSDRPESWLRLNALLAAAKEE